MYNIFALPSFRVSSAHATIVLPWVHPWALAINEEKAKEVPMKLRCTCMYDLLVIKNTYLSPVTVSILGTRSEANIHVQCTCILASYPGLPREGGEGLVHTVAQFCTGARGNVICKYGCVMERHSIAYVYKKRRLWRLWSPVHAAFVSLTANRAISLFSPQSTQQNQDLRSC